VYDLILHLFFIEATGHLWAVSQEMVFYAVFPIVAFVSYSILRNRIFLIIPCLLLVIFWWSDSVTIRNVYLFGMNDVKLPLRLDVFLIGVLCSYLYFGLWQKREFVISPWIIRNFLAVAATVILLLFIFFSNGYLLHNSRTYAQMYYFEFAFAAALLIFIVCCSGENYLTGFLSSSLLSSLGVVSYSLYLFHPLILQFIMHTGGGALSGAVLFVLVSICSYFIACLFYYFIERPVFHMHLRTNLRKAVE